MIVLILFRSLYCSATVLKILSQQLPGGGTNQIHLCCADLAFCNIL